MSLDEESESEQDAHMRTQSRIYEPCRPGQLPPRATAATDPVADAVVEPPLQKEVAAALVKRSIQFGHGRLAVIRLCIAVHCGAAFDPEQWHYCLDVVARDANQELADMLDEARRHCIGRELSADVR